MRRATQPLNPDAVAAANAAVAQETNGRPLTMGPEDAELRKKWMDAYVKAGGNVTTTSTTRTKPPVSSPSCPTEEKNFVELQYSYADGIEGVPNASYEVLDLDTNGIVASGSLDSEGYCYVDIPLSTKKVEVHFWNDPEILELLPEEIRPPDEASLKNFKDWASRIYAFEKDTLGDYYSGGLDWTWGVIQGDFNDDPTTGQIVAGTLLTLIPYVDTAGDIRDVAANLDIIILDRRYNETMPWVALLLSLVGAIPELGTLIKGYFKLLGNGVVTKVKIPKDELIKVFNKYAKGDAVKYMSELAADLPKHGDFAKAKLKSILDETKRMLDFAIDHLPEKYASRARRIKPSVEKAADMADEKLDEAVTEIKKILDESTEEAAENSKIGHAQDSITVKQEAQAPRQEKWISVLKHTILAANPRLYALNHKGKIILQAGESFSKSAVWRNFLERGQKLVANGPLKGGHLKITPVAMFERGVLTKEGKLLERAIVEVEADNGMKFLFYRSSATSLGDATVTKTAGRWVAFPGWAQIIYKEGEQIVDKSSSDLFMKTGKEGMSSNEAMKYVDNNYDNPAFQEISRHLQEIYEKEILPKLPDVEYEGDKIIKKIDEELSKNMDETKKFKRPDGLNEPLEETKKIRRPDDFNESLDTVPDSNSEINRNWDDTWDDGAPLDGIEGDPMP